MIQVSSNRTRMEATLQSLSKTTFHRGRAGFVLGRGVLTFQRGYCSFVVVVVSRRDMRVTSFRSLLLLSQARLAHDISSKAASSAVYITISLRIGRMRHIGRQAAPHAVRVPLASAIRLLVDLSRTEL